MTRNMLLKLSAYMLCIIHGSKVVIAGSLPNEVNISRYPRSYTDDGCTLPPHPKNGLWILQNGDGEREGQQVKSNSILVFECRKGYKLSSSSSFVICLNKWNVENMPECLKLCPPVSSTGTTIVKCTGKSGQEVGCHEATQDTYMSYSCAAFYEAPFGYKTTAFCLDGEWNSPAPICQPICGKKVHDDVTPLVYGGKIQTVIEYPWVVSLYSKNSDETYTNVCGGSIINQKLVLTAAHCVTNVYGDALASELFLVGAGKLFNAYRDPRDTEAQYLEVSNVIVHPTYRGDSRRYQADIAVLVIKGRFFLNKLVQPVCFSDINKINLQVNSLGVVAGFGVKEGGVPSDELRVLEIPYKSEETCAKELPGDWGDRYNVIDKLCAGFYNQSMGVCNGDSGNGLFFRNKENNRFFVHGVVSVSISKKGQCNIQHNALYTKVAYHYDFVDKELTKYYVKDCTLPPYPENGKWALQSLHKKPGDVVQSSTVLEISCNDGYKLSSDVSHFACESAFVMPTCEKLCPVLNVKFEHSCKAKGGDKIHCNDATENAVVTYSCPQDYLVPNGTTNSRKCINGAWESPEIACVFKDGVHQSQDSVEDDSYRKVTCIYNGNAYQSGIKPEELNATLCNYVIYNSVGLTHDGKIRYKRETDVGYQSVANMKKRNPKLKVLVTVYGSGKESTDEYPTMASNVVTRHAFASNLAEFLETFDFDGANIHWNVPMQKEQYIDLLSEIKAVFAPKKWLLTASVYFAPTYLGYNPLKLYSIVDWINLESYNFYDELAKYTGQNSALYASSLENDFDFNFLNVKSAAFTWDSYGFKNNKISIGLAFYGRYYTLKNPGQHNLHSPVTGSTNISDTGLVSYSKLCDEYKDWTRVWDEEQKNPYKYHKKKWVGYDDKESIKLKAEYAQNFDFFGVTVNSVDQDDVYGKCGTAQILLKSAHDGLGTDVL